MYSVRTSTQWGNGASLNPFEFRACIQSSKNARIQQLVGVLIPLSSGHVFSRNVGSMLGSLSAS